MRQLRSTSWDRPCSKCGGKAILEVGESYIDNVWLEATCLHCGKVEYVASTKWGLMIIIPTDSISATTYKTHGNTGMAKRLGHVKRKTIKKR